jgi:hypothetical protein
VPLEFHPPQPNEVAAAVERLLAEGGDDVDPWWAAGLGEALRGDGGSPAEDARGGAGVVEA